MNGSLVIDYSVPSAIANSTYDLTIEFFLADAGGAEGRTFLGSDIYATGDVVLNGGDTVHGGVICGGQFEGRNDWQIFPGDGEIPPGINPAAGGRVTGVRIGAWLK